MIQLKYGKRKLINFRGSQTVVGGLTAANKIQILLYISKEFAAINKIQALYDAVIALSAEIFEVDNVTLRLWNGEALVPVKAMDLSGKRPLQSGEGFSGRSFEEKRSLLVSNLELHPEMLDRFESTRCVLCVPIPLREKILGTISLEKNIPYFFKEEDQEILEAMASQLGLALNEVNLVEGLLSAEKNIQRDLKMGRKVQGQIVPSEVLPWDGLEIAFHYEPMMEVSGDYFDVVRRSQSLTLLIADVSGHGVPAALVTMSIHYQFRHAVLAAKGLREILEELNQTIMPKLPEDTYFSAQIVRIYGDHSFSYVNAGHPKMVHFHADRDEFEQLDTAGNLIGIMNLSRDDFEEKFGKLLPGDALMLLTDGMTEQRNPEKKEAGIEQVLSWFTEESKNLEAAGPARFAQSLCDRLVSRLREHAAGMARADDRTLLMVRSHPKLLEVESDLEFSRMALRGGEKAAALQHALEGYGKIASHHALLLHLADLYFNEKKYLDAEPYLSSYLEVSGDDSPEVSRKMGEIYFHNGKITSAKQELKKAVAANPLDRDSLLLLVDCYLKEKTPKKAAAVLKQAIKNFPMDNQIEALMNRVIAKTLMLSR